LGSYYIVELMTHNLLGDRVFKKGIMRDPSYGSDGYGKAAITRSARQSAPATHHPHRVFGTVGNTDDTSPDAHTVQGSLGRVIMAFAKLSVSRNIFVRFYSMQLILIISHLFWQIRLTGLGSPDCSSHLESGIIITVSNELQPKLSL